MKTIPIFFLDDPLLLFPKRKAEIIPNFINLKFFQSYIEAMNMLRPLYSSGLKSTIK